MNSILTFVESTPMELFRCLWQVDRVVTALCAGPLTWLPYYSPTTE